jgi:DNA invertase Pin-like site-specific DNA recombinase
MSMSENNSSVRAACLYRNSDDRQENSVARQRQGVEPYARHKGYETVAEYVFDGIPGDKINSHPTWRRLLKDAEAGKWSVLLMDEQSRLSREDPDYFVRDVKIPLKEAGIRVDSVAKGILDWDTIAGDIVTLVHTHQSRDEVRSMSRRVLGGMVELAKDGLFYGWRCPYGLRVERTIDPVSGKVHRQCIFGPEEEVRTVRWIFDCVANRGWSLRRICHELDARGVKPPLRSSRAKGPGHWCPQTIRKIVTNRKYVGDFVWNETHRGKYHRWLGGQEGKVKQNETINRRKLYNDEKDCILVPDIIPPIIEDRDLFIRAGVVLKQAQKQTSPNGENHRYLFSHMLVCGDCASFMRGMPDRRSNIKGYICSMYKEHGSKACHRNMVHEEPLLKAILAKMLDVVLNPTRLDAIEKEMKTRLESERSSGEADRLRQRIAALDRDIAQGGVRLIRVPEDQMARVVATIREWEGEKAGLVARLQELETGDSQQQAVLDEARRQLWRLREGLESNDLEAQAAVIREVVSKVEVHFEQVQTDGKRSRKGKGGRLLCRSTCAVVYVRPGLGLSCLCDLSGRAAARWADTDRSRR